MSHFFLMYHFPDLLSDLSVFFHRLLRVLTIKNKNKKLSGNLSISISLESVIGQLFCSFDGIMAA